MREIEFLPDWYRQVRRRRMWLVVQWWSTFGLLIVLLVWTGVAHFRVITARRDHRALQQASDRAEVDLKRLDELNLLKRRWDEQGEVLSKLGVSIESTRLIGTVAQATPESVALVGMHLQIDEKIEVPRSAAAARASKDAPPTIDRKLLIRLQGIAPSDAEVADLMAKLATITFFNDVSMSYSKDADRAGRLVREFEVTFMLDLNAPSGT